jgi:hypothetical protein
MKNRFIITLSLLVFLIFICGCVDDSAVVGEAYHTSKIDFSQKYISPKYVKSEINYIKKIKDVEQREILTAALNTQKELASGKYAKKYPNLRIDEKTGELKQTVTMNDGSTQEFVLLGYNYLKNEYEREKKSVRKQWPEITQLVNDVKEGKITARNVITPSLPIDDENNIVATEDVQLNTNDHSVNRFYGDEWQETINEATIKGKKIDVDSNNNVYVIGDLYSNYLDNHYKGKGDAIFISYDFRGNKNWHKIVSSDNIDKFLDLVIDSKDNVYVLARTSGKVKTFNNQTGFHIMKYNQQGKLLFTKKIGGRYDNFGNGIFIDNNDNFYLAEVERYQSEYYLTFNKYNSNFEKVWSKEIPCEGYNFEVYDATFDFARNAYFVGFAKNFDNSDGGISGFILKLNSDGDKLWSKKFEGAPTASVYGVELKDNSIFVIGNKGNYNQKEAFIAKFSLNGNLIWKNSLSTDYGKDQLIFQKDDFLYGFYHSFPPQEFFRILSNGEIIKKDVKLDADFNILEYFFKDSYLYLVGHKSMIYEKMSVSKTKVDFSNFSTDLKPPSFDLKVDNKQISSSDNNYIAELKLPSFKYNDEFNKEDFSPFGLMYHADELYEEGVFPFWPYLTSVKNQAARGTCEEFAIAAGTELVLMNHLDLSEQHLNFHSNALYAWPGYEGLPIALEENWPYNYEECNAEEGELGYYVTEDAEVIPCSRTIHQGIPLNNPINQGRDFSEFETYCDEYYIDDDITPCRNFRPYAETVDSEHAGCVIMAPFLPLDELMREEELVLIKEILLNNKYPLYFTDKVKEGNAGIIGAGGYEKTYIVPKKDREITCTSCGGGHAMLVVGYIPKENIPKIIKNANPGYFDPEQDYLIIKNSWSKNWADGGFFYIGSKSVLNGRIYGLQPLKYDKYSTIYLECDATRSEGVSSITG